MDLGERIAVLREEQAMSQAELAERAKISPSTLSQIESGKVPRPHVGTVRKIARALGVEPTELRRAREETSPKAQSPQPSPEEAVEVIQIKGEVSERTRRQPWSRTVTHTWDLEDALEGVEADEFRTTYSLGLCADYVHRRADSVERLIEDGHATSVEWAREFNRDVVSLSHLYTRIMALAKFNTEGRTENERLKMFRLRDAVSRLSDVAKKLDAAIEPIANREHYAKGCEERDAALSLVIDSAA